MMHELSVGATVPTPHWIVVSFKFMSITLAVDPVTSSVLLGQIIKVVPAELLFATSSANSSQTETQELPGLVEGANVKDASARQTSELKASHPSSERMPWH
mmetsp:Transcript_21850/g.33358  ORF Transcript_21850/g.33358 Transcript_21850/m.33358 type:complete len:101 (-) Transcript_21850:270-572(-)